MALVLGKVLHLGSHVDKRNALDRPQHAREGLLGVDDLTLTAALLTGFR